MLLYLTLPSKFVVPPLRIFIRLSTAPLGEYYGVLYIIPSTSSGDIPFLSSMDTPTFGSLREDLLDISVGFELQDFESTTESFVQTFFVPESPLLGSPTIFSFTAQYFTPYATASVDIVLAIRVVGTVETSPNQVAAARMVNGTALNSLPTSGTIEIAVELRETVFPETVYEMRVFVKRCESDGGDVVAQSEPAYIVPYATDFLLIERYERNVLKYHPTYLHMEIHYRTSHPLNSVDVIVVVTSVSDPSAPSILFAALDAHVRSCDTVKYVHLILPSTSI